MAVDPADAAEVEKLYEYGERLSEAKDKSEVPPSLSPNPQLFISSI